MDVAIVATARFAITEPAAGGLEVHTRVLATELLARGHKVTVYAAGGDGPFDVEVMLPVDFTGSETARRDVASPAVTLLSEHHSYLDAMLRIADADHDVVHVNAVHYLPFVSSSLVRAPMVGTLHSPPTPWLESAIVLAKRSRRPPWLISVSAANAKAWGHGVVNEVIHNGIDLTSWMTGPGGDGVVWTGRLAPEKAPHLAIDAARAAGRSITLLGPVFDDAYFDREVVPRLDHDVTYLGHADTAGLAEAVGRAAVAVVTPEWEEPFGLVVAEALACGTPVAAFDRGALAELLDDRVGRLAPPADVPALARAIDVASGLDRATCRRVAEDRFAATTMAKRYERCFSGVVAGAAA